MSLNCLFCPTNSLNSKIFNSQWYTKGKGANYHICEAETSKHFAIFAGGMTQKKTMSQSSVVYADVCAHTATVQNMQQGGTGGPFGCLRGCDWQSATKSQRGGDRLPGRIKTSVPLTFSVIFRQVEASSDRCHLKLQLVLMDWLRNKETWLN